MSIVIDYTILNMIEPISKSKKVMVTRSSVWMRENYTMLNGWGLAAILLTCILVVHDDLFKLGPGKSQLSRHHPDQFKLGWRKFSIDLGQGNHLFELFLPFFIVLRYQVDILIGLFQHHV